MNEPRAWLNGAPVESPLARSRALHYGDGVFRTLLVWDSQPLDLDAHLAKLGADAAALRIEAPSLELLHGEALRAAGDGDRAVLKIILARQAGARGYRANTNAADRLLLHEPAPAYPAHWWDEGVRAERSEVVLAEQPRLAGIKHLNRLEQVLASLDWPDGVQERILCDAAGRAICGTRSNLFWVRDGLLATPELSRCGIAGVTRSKIIELASTLQVELKIMDCPWNTLAQAEEVFVSNSLVGIWPLAELAGRRLPAPGPVTRRLMQALSHPRLC